MALMTTKELAAHLNLSMASVYRLIDKKAVPHIRVNGSVRFRKEAVETWLQELETTPTKKDEVPLPEEKKNRESNETNG